MEKEREIWDHMKSDGKIVFVRYGTGMVTFGDDAAFVGKVSSRIVKNDCIVIPAVFKISIQHEVLNNGKEVREVVYFNL